MAKHHIRHVMGSVSGDVYLHTKDLEGVLIEYTTHVNDAGVDGGNPDDPEVKMARKTFLFVLDIISELREGLEQHGETITAAED